VIFDARLADLAAILLHLPVVFLSLLDALLLVVVLPVDAILVGVLPVDTLLLGALLVLPLLILPLLILPLLVLPLLILPLLVLPLLLHPLLAKLLVFLAGLLALFYAARFFGTARLFNATRFYPRFVLALRRTLFLALRRTLFLLLLLLLLVLRRLAVGLFFLVRPLVVLVLAFLILDALICLRIAQGTDSRKGEADGGRHHQSVEGRDGHSVSPMGCVVARAPTRRFVLETEIAGTRLNKGLRRH
jgi:hypothetical protein